MKKHILLFLLAGLAVTTTSLIAISQVEKTDVVFGDGDTNDYHITFNNNHVVSHKYNDSMYVEEFSVGSPVCIGDKYDLYTVDYDETSGYGTNCYGDEGAFNFDKEDSIIEIANAETYYNITFVFKLLTRATFNEVDSAILMYDSKVGHNTSLFFTNDGEEGEYTYWKTEFGCGSYWGATIKFIQIDLYFSCAK